MAEVGILHPGERVELIHGEIIHMSPIGIPHAGILMQLIAYFSRLGVDKVALSSQSPLRIGMHSEPEPDLTVLRGPAKQYLSRRAVSADAYVVIEIADTSWDYDWNVKRPLYAESGVAELWVIDAIGRAIHLCRKPSDRRYVDETILRGNDRIAAQAFADHVTTVRDLLEA